MFLFIGDNTPRDRADDLGHQLRAELDRAQRLQALGVAAASAAHDFNNVLTVILGTADALLRDPRGLNGDAIAALRKIVEAAEFGHTLTSELTTFLRRGGHGDRELFNVDELVLRSVGPFRALLGRSITLVTDLRAPHLRVRGLPSRIEQVLLNLVMNSREALPNGGVIRIETSEALEDGERRLALRVNDNGVGMSDEIRARIFEWGFTSRPDAGSGLGLALTRTIVEEHGGTIRVDSKPHQFTTFTVLLPVESASNDLTTLSV